jgi:hypothetical protein
MFIYLASGLTFNENIEDDVDIRGEVDEPRPIVCLGSEL